MYAVLLRKLLAQECPRSPPRSLVLELEVARHVPSHMLDDGADRRPGLELVKRANLGRILVRDILATQRTRQGSRRGVLAARSGSSEAEYADYVALSVYGMMPFVGRGGIESTAGVADIGA